MTKEEFSQIEIGDCLVYIGPISDWYLNHCVVVEETTFDGQNGYVIEWTKEKIPDSFPGKTVTLSPESWEYVKNETSSANKKCKCGSKSIGWHLHSEWCDLYDN